MEFARKNGTSFEEGEKAVVGLRLANVGSYNCEDLLEECVTILVTTRPIKFGKLDSNKIFQIILSSNCFS